MLLLTIDISVFFIGVTSQLKIDVFLDWGSLLPKHLLSFWRVVIDVQFGLLTRLKSFPLFLKHRRMMHHLRLSRSLTIQRVLILRYSWEPLELKLSSCGRKLIVVITIHTYFWVLLIARILAIFALIEIRCRDNEEWTMLSIECYIILKLLSKYWPLTNFFGALRLFRIFLVISQGWLLFLMSLWILLHRHNFRRQNLVYIIIRLLSSYPRSDIRNVGQFRLLNFILLLIIIKWFLISYLKVADLV